MTNPKAAAILKEYADNAPEAFVPGGPDHLLAKASHALSRQIQYDARIIWIAVGLLVILFLAGLTLVFRLQGNPQAMAAVVGGNALSLLLVVGWLERLWKRLSELRLVTWQLTTLPARERLVLIRLMLQRWGGEETEEKKS